MDACDEKNDGFQLKGCQKRQNHHRNRTNSDLEISSHVDHSISTIANQNLGHLILMSNSLVLHSIYFAPIYIGTMSSLAAI